MIRGFTFTAPPAPPAPPPFAALTPYQAQCVQRIAYSHNVTLERARQMVLGEMAGERDRITTREQLEQTLAYAHSAGVSFEAARAVMLAPASGIPASVRMQKEEAAAVAAVTPKAPAVEHGRMSQRQMEAAVAYQSSSGVNYEQAREWALRNVVA